MVDVALAAVDVTATVFVMNSGGHFHRRHLLAEARRHLALTSSVRCGGAHDVHVYDEGVKRFRHPVVGDLELVHEALALPGPADTGLPITVYSAGPGTPSEEAPRLLAPWAATSHAPVAPADADDRLRILLAHFAHAARDAADIRHQSGRHGVLRQSAGVASDHDSPRTPIRDADASGPGS
ncbi:MULTISPECIES: MmyB family transcriptional regulator [Streptomyces]|uniref:MmyB family transcriptional regulator n=1 Tax=Streptomyces TaxID=1883 RepID=UPI001E32E455|nr:hypothetical protein [Streptomyces canarius]